MANWTEINFDGMVGPTHSYTGLAFGNTASQLNAGATSRPRDAALQGLAKMECLIEWGIPQGILPPQPRPPSRVLEGLGFSGDPAEAAARLWQIDPSLLSALISASSMWAANAATVSPSLDTSDGLCHISVANLGHNFHRSIEADYTRRTLSAIFSDDRFFQVHPPLPGGHHLGDEGAANHMRLSKACGEKGVEVFVYGNERGGRYPSRQKRRASEAISRRHGLDPEQTLFVEQSEDAIQAGAFHNDVLAVANGKVLFAHQDAFEAAHRLYEALRKLIKGFHLIEVPRETVSLKTAVAAYLFNSQLVTMPSGELALIAPSECERSPIVSAYLATLLQSNGPIRQVKYVDLNQSMKNGGGPACLRLRILVSEEAMAAVDPRFILTRDKLASLKRVVEETYPATLSSSDLANPQFYRDCDAALGSVLDVLGARNLFDGM
ncbi:MAG TPA: N-succinylarginine dihydrolase [Hyphomicrobium sp.]|nr:N-succinylarginine dihydrolase [Hyphomicrobium sp.]